MEVEFLAVGGEHLFLVQTKVWTVSVSVSSPALPPRSLGIGKGVMVGFPCLHLPLPCQPKVWRGRGRMRRAGQVFLD